MSDIHGIKVWSSTAVKPGHVLTIADLTKFRDAIFRGNRVAPSVAVMSPYVYAGYKDAMHTEAVRRFLGITGPFEPITVRGVWRSFTYKAGEVLYRIRKAARVLRYGSDPEAP